MKQNIGPHPHYALGILLDYDGIKNGCSKPYGFKAQIRGLRFNPRYGLMVPNSGSRTQIEPNSRTYTN